MEKPMPMPNTRNDGLVEFVSWLSLTIIIAAIVAISVLIYVLV